MGKRKRQEEGGGESWMNTYADMVTLLLTFFVMLFSMSSVSEEKWEVLIKAFTNRGNETSQVVVTPIGEGHDMAANQGESPLTASGENIDTSTELPSDFDELYDYLKSYVEQNNMEGSVDISKGEGLVYIRFQDNLFFNADQYILRQESFDILNFLGDALFNVQDQIMMINIDGHTAAVNMIQDYPVSDWRLSGERAASVAIFFEEQKGIDPTKIIQIGYGKSRPIADNDTPEGRQQNRRVDMMIVSNDGTPDAEQLLTQLLTGTYDPSEYPKSSGLADAILRQVESQAEGTDAEGVITTEPAPQDPGTPPEGEAAQAAGEVAPPAGEAVPPAEGQQPAQSQGEAGAAAPVEPAPAA